MEDFNYKGIEEFYRIYIELEQVKRAGWVIRNVPAERLESVADHTLQVVMLAATFCHEFDLKFDMSKVLQMSFIHDLGEVIIGDVPEIDKNYASKKEKEKSAVTKLLSPLSKDVSSFYLSLWTEMDEKQTPIAKFVHQVDKIDAVMKAKIYSEEYDRWDIFDEFYDGEVRKGIFDDSPLKVMFKSLRAH